jgi:translation initiation factor IF-1
MVKNTSGGSKTKSQARKLQHEVTNDLLRVSTHPLEVYAVVTKLFGNSRCQVQTQEDKIAQCVIRNKFKGRNKRFHFVQIGSILLVGFRHWDTTMSTCDLLHVYSPAHISTLMALPSNPLGSLLSILHPSLQDDLFTIEHETKEEISTETSLISTKDTNIVSSEEYIMDNICIDDI